MTYAETIEYLYGLEATRGWDLKLERVRAALEALGRPERAYPSVLIAGTNGKGTTAALTHGALVQAGLRVGLYTSPHLVHFTERIRVGRAEALQETVVDGVARIRRVAPPEETGLTFFEVSTLLAFLVFAEAKVDVAVVEVGLGGRLDATNVLEPACSAVTSIGWDHQEYLGDTLGAIALEKGGVLRAETATVLGPHLPQEADDALRERAAACDARIVRAAAVRDRVPPIGIRGEHIRDDGAVAWALLDELARRHPELAVSDDDRARGFAEVRWPGRLELFPGTPPVLVDGAHNEESMTALCRELPHVVEPPVRLVFGALSDKPWRALAALLRPLVSEVAVVPLSQRRGVAAEELAQAFSPHHPTRIEPDPFSALERFRQEDAATPVLATGSLFLVGEVHAARLAKTGQASVFDPPMWQGAA